MVRGGEEEAGTGGAAEDEYVRISGAILVVGEANGILEFWSGFGSSTER